MEETQEVVMINDFNTIFGKLTFLSEITKEYHDVSESYKSLMIFYTKLGQYLGELKQEKSKMGVFIIKSMIEEYMATDILKLEIEEDEYDFTLDNIQDVDLASEQIIKVGLQLLNTIGQVINNEGLNFINNFYLSAKSLVEEAEEQESE